MVLFLIQIERDTLGMLQCHPYPNEYVDPSKPVPHTAFFMGLLRKQGVPIREGQQFDIRGTVEEFRHSVNIYDYWKPGMEIFVSHVRRKQIPLFVFPEGVRPMRPQRSLVPPKSSSPGIKAAQSLSSSPPSQQATAVGDDIEDAALESVKRPDERAMISESSKRLKISEVSIVSTVSSELSYPSQTSGEVSRRTVNVETATVANSCRNGAGSITMNSYDFERITSGRIPTAETTVPSRVTLRMQAVSSQSESCQSAFVDELEVCRNLAI